MLGKTEDASQYYGVAGEDHGKRSCKEYVSSTGRVGENTQTVYCWRSVRPAAPDELRSGAAKRLVARSARAEAPDDGLRRHAVPVSCAEPLWVSRRGVRAAQSGGISLVAVPGEEGATTIWERWDGQKPDGSFQDGE